jgi:hypothetical protein
MLCVMWTTTRARLAPSALLLALLAVPVATLTGCTGDDGPDAPSAAPSDTPTGAAPSLRDRPEPFRVRYRRMAGEVPKRGRAATLTAVSRPVRAWIDNGFVAGPWPREAYGQAYVPFGDDIADRVRRDADLLTMRPLGGSLVQVVPQRRRIGVSVTGVRGHVVGATARVDVRVLGIDDGGNRSRVAVRGDLYLTRVPEHGWKIFGYRLDRWVEEGAMTRPGHKAGARAKTGGGA